MDFVDLLQDPKQYKLVYPSTYIPGATYRITKLDDGSSFDIVTDQNGEARTDWLMPGEYSIVEVEAPVGYSLDTKTYTTTLSQGQVYRQTFTNKKDSLDIGVEKVWNGKAYKSVEGVLLANGVELEMEKLSEENDWKHVFKNQKRLDDNSNDIKYTVKEIGENNGLVKLGDRQYEVKYDGNITQGFTITNKSDDPENPKPEKPKKTVKKANKKSSKVSPKTGDLFNPSLYLGIIALAGGGLGVIRKKK